MANEESEYPTELRGYKRTVVDAIIQELRGDLITASKSRQSALEDVTALKEQLNALGASDSGGALASYAGLGARLESILRIAEEQSTTLIGQADIDAEKLTANAKLTAAALLEDATRDAARLIDDATNESATLRDGAAADAEKAVAFATEEADRVRSESIDEAADVRGAVATETAKARATAKRETEALRAEAKREIAELKVVAEREMNTARSDAAELSKKIAAERASHELTLTKIQQEAALAQTTLDKDVAETTARLAYDNDKQAEKLAFLASEARADLEAELTSRRAEAERELLDTHQKAVELNDRFLLKAQEQLKETKARLAEARKDLHKITDAIDGANRYGKLEASKQAQKTLADAQQQGAEIILEAEGEATARVAAAERRLVELRAERDTISEYVESLRSIFGNALRVEAKVAKGAKSSAKAVAATAKEAD